MNQSNQKISVLIICQNSEHSIGRTLKSLSEFDEIVIIDGGSSDKTEEIVNQFPNTKFIYNKWPGFIEQRNISIDHASNYWCFMIDADEFCTPELSKKLHEIVKKENPKGMYRIMRTEYFMGEEVEVGHGKTNYQERLFQKKRVRYTGGNHHEHLLDGRLITGDDSRAENIDSTLRVLHDRKYGINEWLEKLPRFTILVANEKIDKGRKISAMGVLFSFPGEFLKVYRKSWRGGKISFLVCILHASMKLLIKSYIYAQQNFPAYQKSRDHIKQKNLG